MIFGVQFSVFLAFSRPGTRPGAGHGSDSNMFERRGNAFRSFDRGYEGSRQGVDRLQEDTGQAGDLYLCFLILQLKILSYRFQVLSHAFSVTGPMDQPYHVTKADSGDEQTAWLCRISSQISPPGLSKAVTSGIVHADDLSLQGKFSS
eukprot:765766-Hanusia_phi.AAC.4